MPKTSVYNQTVRICEDYLGPAGERFIRRQISTHLGIEPENLTKRQITQLTNWASLAFALLTSNVNEVNGFTNDLLALSSGRE